MKPRLLDFYCKAGGTTKGYQRAGFYVVGVDIEPQPHYCGEEFYQADALDVMNWLLHGQGFATPIGIYYNIKDFDAYSASPPCQKWSTGAAIHGYSHPDLITPTHELLSAMGKPYIIENVRGAPLIDAFMLCGTMFGLKVKRHRYFECNFPIHFLPASCSCKGKAGFTNAKSGFSSFANGAKLISVAGHNFSVEDAKVAMNIDWMNQDELREAIPPAYTEYIGKYLMQVVANPEGR